MWCLGFQGHRLKGMSFLRVKSSHFWQAVLVVYRFGAPNVSLGGTQWNQEQGLYVTSQS